MSSLLRGEPMELVQLIIPKETAYSCVGALGKIGVVQFNDVGWIATSVTLVTFQLNQTKSVFQRYFIRDTRRCEEIVRKLSKGEWCSIQTLQDIYDNKSMKVFRK